MKQLWSPWRINYIRGDRPPDCVFCSAPREQASPENLVLFRGQHSYVMMNRYPYTNGHLMIIPYAHIAMLTDVPADTQIEMLQEINMSIEILREVMNPQGYNVGLNLGASAGAGIRDHIHFHVVPRWVGDTNFMAVVGETNVIVEGLIECFSQLKPAFDCRCGPDDPSGFRPKRGSPDDATADRSGDQGSGV
ncbi:MAG: HIT domain-containing protein [Anaerolineae bacterium]|jgi:ATP adenylyltransferase